MTFTVMNWTKVRIFRYPVLRIQAYNNERCDNDFVSSAGLDVMKGTVKHRSSWHIRWIWVTFILPKVTASFNICTYTRLHLKLPFEMIICLLPSFDYMQCYRIDPCWRQLIWLQYVACLANHNAQITIWDHQMIMRWIHWSQALNSGNPWINFIKPRGQVTDIRSHHFHALPTYTTLPHSIYHVAHNQALVQPKYIWVIGHRCKHMISPNEIMVDLTSSALTSAKCILVTASIQKCLIEWGV